MYQLIELLPKLVGKLWSLNVDRKKEVAVFLDRIGETLEKFSPALKTGAGMDELVKLQAQTLSLATSFNNATSDVLSSADREHLSQLLEKAVDAKKALGFQPGTVGQTELLNTIASAAGVFRAQAMTMTATASQFGR